ncbi:MAG: permease [Alphaproteobacteria bacterium]|nr:permease [Alphaproteobacteria bacterium]
MSRAHYDLPLQQDRSAGFLILLTGLMTFLALATCAAALSLNALAFYWSSGLENNLSIEIPAERSKGGLRDAEEIQLLAERVDKALKQDTNVREIEILDQKAMNDLLAPWLGPQQNLAGAEDLPLPGLISVTLGHTDTDILSSLQERLKKIDADLRVDDHQEWLSGIIRLCRSLQVAAVVSTLVIISTTVIAVAGAMRARMEILRPDVELLHLMGAGDNYITAQFQRHALILSSKGAILGILAAAVVLCGLYFGIGTIPLADSMPEHGMLGMLLLMLLLLPLALCLISALAARIMVLRVLRAMV